MNRNALKPLLITLCFSLLCLSLTACDVSFTFGSNGSSTNPNPCQNNCSSGAGVQGVRLYVEPDDGESVITDAIKSATKSVWLEIYILTDRNVIRALEEAANN
jgi:cardiolipin synthase A/B